MKDNRLVKRVAEKIGDKLRKELICTSSPAVNSMFRSKSLESLWYSLWTDLQRTAPTLSIILEKCILANRSNTVNKNMLVVVTASILLRNCSQRVNLLQRLICLCLLRQYFFILSSI